MSTAIILSGGGAKGAFSVGALSHLMSAGVNIPFDIVSGTSTGALIASLVVINRIDILREIYSTVNNDSIIRQRDPLRMIRTNQPYFFSDAPLINIIKSKITPQVADQIIQSPKILLLSAVNLQSGRITIFSNKSLPSTHQYETVTITTRDTLINALRASSNQAAFMPPVTMKADDGKDYQFIDGGCREVIPCLAVIDQHPSTIYVLSNNPKYIFSVNTTYNSVINVLMRVIAIFIQDVRENDIAALEAWKKSIATNVDIHYIEPETDLDPDYPTGLRFEPGRMGVMMAKGEARAQAVLDTLSSSPRILAPSGENPMPEPNERCVAITMQGIRCKNKPVTGTTYCHVHQHA